MGANKSRTYPVRCDVMRSIMNEKNISQAALARAVDMSKKAIQNILNKVSEPLEDNLVNIAAALGVKWRTLVDDCEVAPDIVDEAAGFTTNGSRTALAVAIDEVDVDVTVDENFSRWALDKQAVLMEGIRLVLQSATTIRISKKAREGSVKITLRMTREQADRLQSAFEAHALDHLKVTGLETIELSDAERQPQLYSDALPEGTESTSLTESQQPDDLSIDSPYILLDKYYIVATECHDDEYADYFVASVQARAVVKLVDVTSMAGKRNPTCLIVEGSFSYNQFIRIVRDGVVVYPPEHYRVRTALAAKIITFNSFVCVNIINTGSFFSLSMHEYQNFQVNDVIEVIVLKKRKE